MTKNLFYFLLFAFALIACKKEGEKWKSHTDARKRFSIEYPPKFQPYHQTQKPDTANKGANEEDFLFIDEKSGKRSMLSVSILTVPERLQKTSRSEVYNTMPIAQDVERKQITFQQLDAIETQSKTQQGTLVRSIYLLDKDSKFLYILNVNGDSEFVKSEMATRFIDSFKVLQASK